MISYLNTQQIRERLPNLQNLVEREETDYEMIFVSVFDHWLTQNEFQPKIHKKDKIELKERRKKLRTFIESLFKLTSRYSWKYDKNDFFVLHPFEKISEIINKCDIQNQHGE